MSKKDQEYWDRELFATRLRVIADQINELADTVEAIVFKKTTQRSPEWSGACNRHGQVEQVLKDLGNPFKWGG